MNPTEQSQIGVLNVRIGSLEHNLATFVDSVNKKFDSLSLKLDERGRTQWGTIALFASLLVGVTTGFYTFVFTPVYNAMQELRNVDSEFRIQMVPRPELERQFRGIESLLQKYDARMDKISEASLPKAEFQEYIALRDKYDDARIDAMEKRANQISNRLDRLDDQYRAACRILGPPGS